MKKICVLGYNGFIGSNVLEVLKQNFSVNESDKYDFLVNCAGFSKMYEGNKNPDKMRNVEDSILEKINGISFDKIIHLSTIYIEVYPQDVYSRIKVEMEDKILSKYENATVLRLGGVLGKGLKKNVVFDLITNGPLYVTSDSFYNYISAYEIANIISYLINNPIAGIINVGSSKSISVADIANILKKNPIYGNKKETINFDISRLQHFYKVGSSREYVEEFYNKTLQGIKSVRHYNEGKK